MPILVAFVALLSLAAAANILVGVYLLAGDAWTFIVAGALLFAAAAFLRSGLKSNG